MAGPSWILSSVGLEKVKTKAPPETVESTITAWKTCAELLAGHAADFKQSTKNANQQNDPPAIMFARTFDFGLMTIEGSKILLEKDVKNALLVCTLVRAFYEAAVRLHWASRAPDGWQRLQAYFANGERKWANEAKGIQATASPAIATAERSQKILDRTDPSGNKYKPAPNMKQLLQELVGVDVVQGIREKKNRAADFDYTNVYRFLCKPAHGSMTALRKPAEFLSHAKVGMIMATFSLLQAHCHVGAADSKQEVERTAQQLVKIIEGTRG